jgi:hypothetical protein
MTIRISKTILWMSLMLVPALLMPQGAAFAACSGDECYPADIWNYENPNENFYRRIALDPYPDGVPNFPVTGHEINPPIDPTHKPGVFFYVTDSTQMDRVLDMIVRKTKVRLTG